MILTLLGAGAGLYAAYELYRWFAVSDVIPPVLSPTGTVSSEYGWRLSPIDGLPRHHDGIDIAGVRGKPIVAVEDGVITTSRLSSSAGEYIILQGKAGTKYEYMHLAARYAKPGQVVQQGQVLGLVGATGNVTGPHLHFEVRVADGTPRGRAVDPRWYFRSFWQAP